MTPADAFLAAILERPDDDAPRLLYADWLDEPGNPEGDPARAEFIRVECAMVVLEATMLRLQDGAPDGRRREFKRYVVLRCRERELWNDQAIRWRESCPGVPVWDWIAEPDPLPVPNLQVMFRRGFIDSVACVAAAWLEHADALLAAAPISEVTLTTWPEMEEVRGNHTIGSRKFVGRKRLHPLAVYVGDALAAEWPRVKKWNLSLTERFTTEFPAAWIGAL